VPFGFCGAEVVRLVELIRIARNSQDQVKRSASRSAGRWHRTAMVFVQDGHKAGQGGAKTTHSCLGFLC
jgi:hypothetical protein